MSDDVQMLQEAERQSGRALELVTQAATALDEFKQWSTQFSGSDYLKELNEALHDVHELLAQAVVAHNAWMAKLKEKQYEAQQAKEQQEQQEHESSE